MNRTNGTLNNIYSTQASNQTSNGYTGSIYSAAAMQQQQSDSPAHRIYRQRSAKTFSQIMRPEEDVYAVHVGKTSTSTMATTATTQPVMPDYLQEHQPSRVSPHLLPMDQPMQQQQQQQQPVHGVGYDSAWLDRQERVLRDIERRLERLEEQQQYRRFQPPPPPQQDQNGSLAAAAVTNESFLRLLDQMQAQQRQMQRMQEQMDELRRAMEQSLQQRETILSSKQKEEETRQSVGENKSDETKKREGNGSSNNSNSAQPQQNMMFWLGAALVVTFLFAIVAVLIAVIAVARSNKTTPAAVTPTIVAPVNYPYDLSSSMPLSTRSYVPSPTWNSASTEASGAMRAQGDDLQNQDTRNWSPESMRGGGAGAGSRVPMSFMPRNHVLFSP